MHSELKSIVGFESEGCVVLMQCIINKPKDIRQCVST